MGLPEIRAGRDAGYGLAAGRAGIREADRRLASFLGGVAAGAAARELAPAERELAADAPDARAGVAYGFGWLGSAATACRADVAAKAAGVHRRAVALALGTRRAWARLAVALVTGAAGLAVRLSVPGGTVFAIPAAWRFIRSVIAEVRAVRAAIGQ